MSIATTHSNTHQPQCNSWPASPANNRIIATDFCSRHLSGTQHYVLALLLRIWTVTIGLLGNLHLRLPHQRPLLPATATVHPHGYDTPQNPTHHRTLSRQNAVKAPTYNYDNPRLNYDALHNLRQQPQLATWKSGLNPRHDTSQYRAYFTPGGVDPSGTRDETDEEKRRRLEREWREQNQTWKPVVDGVPRIARVEQHWRAEWSSFFSSGTASGTHRAMADIDNSYLVVEASSYYRGVNETWTQESYQPGKTVKASFDLAVSCNCVGEAKINVGESNTLSVRGGIKETIGEIGAAVSYSYAFNGRNATVSFSASSAWERTGTSLTFTPKVGGNAGGATVTVSPSVSENQLSSEMDAFTGTISWTCVKE